MNKQAFFLHWTRMSAVLATFILGASAPGTALAQPFPSEYFVEQDQLEPGPGSLSDFGRVVATDAGLVVVGDANHLNFYESENGIRTRRGALEFPTGATWYDADLQGDTLVASRSTGHGEVLIFEREGDRDAALNAWNTTDNLETGPKRAYGLAFSAQDHADAATEGWTLTIRSRLVDDFGDSWTCYVDFTDDNGQRFLIHFDLDDNDDLEVTLGGHESIVIPSLGTGWANYHTHRIVFDPGTGSADYYFDDEKRNVAPWNPTPIAGLNGIRFGTGATGGRGSMNWNKIEFKTAQTERVVASYDAGSVGASPSDLDPVDQGWVELDSTGTSAGPVLADYHSWWELSARFVPVTLPGQFSEPANGFGRALARRDNTLFVGYPQDLDGSADAGSVRIFRKVNGEWIEPPMAGNPDLPEMLVSPEAQPFYRQFGGTLDVDGSRLLVGSFGEPGSSSGNAHVYLEDAGNWELETDLLAVAQLSGTIHVSGVAIEGDRAVVTTPGTAGSPSGLAQVYEHANGVWSKVATLSPLESVDAQDAGVILNGDVVVIVPVSYNEASHFVFARDDFGDWVQADHLVYPDGGVPVGVDFDADLLVVGLGHGESGGETAFVFQPYHRVADALAAFVDEILYYPSAAAGTVLDPNEAAFRYRHLLYEQDGGGIRPNFDLLPGFYGDDERNLADKAEAETVRGLLHQPDSTVLREKLLDVRYDRTVIETILARRLLADASRAHYGDGIGVIPPANGFMIDQEIPLFEATLEAQRAAIEYLLAILSDDLGLPTDPPLGYQLFLDRVPGRALEPAQYLNAGAPEFVVPQSELFGGYKDAVLGFELLRDCARTANTLARLRVARDGTGDREAARALAAGYIRFLYNHGQLLKGMFENLPDENDPSGMRQAIAGWAGGISDLGGVEELLESGANVLGFDDDFLFFIQNEPGIFHSFDVFKQRLSLGPADSPVQIALDRLQEARASFANYEDREDQLGAQFDNSSITYRDRLRDIVGVFPDDPDYGDDPRTTPGSELEQQYRSIEIARLRVRRNQVEISNLRKEVGIERERAAATREVYIRYGDQRASIEESLAEINAAQAGANQLTDYLNPANLVSGASIAIALNGGVQTIAELKKGKLAAQKEKLAAMENAELDGIESDARIKTLLLQMNTLVVDSLEAALLLTQEANRLAALFREKADLERKIAEQNAALKTRFFADPSHRLVFHANMLRADIAFQNAQDWLFFMVRALQYKHNTSFVRTYNQKTFTLNSIFKLRNAEEQRDFYLAMVEFDNLLNLGDPERRDSFSVREDFFGYIHTNTVGEVLAYPDPVTAESVDAFTAFRSRLTQFQNEQGLISLPFSTVRQIPGGFFFQGPDSDENGPVPRTGRYLDKIRSMLVRLPGAFTPGQLSGNLTYGGTSFIRNPTVGVVDPVRADRIVGEMTPYSTRYWFFDTSLADPEIPREGRWNFRESLKINGIILNVAPDDGSVPTAGDIIEFRERSVATSEWVLEIPTKSGNTTLLDLAKLNDIEIWFWHYSKSRQ